MRDMPTRGAIARAEGNAVERGGGPSRLLALFFGLIGRAIEVRVLGAPGGAAVARVADAEQTELAGVHSEHCAGLQRHQRAVELEVADAGPGAAVVLAGMQLGL